MSKMKGHLIKQQLVRCNRCHWYGYDYDLTPILVSVDPDTKTEVYTSGCPACLTDDKLEYKEEI